MQTVCSPTVSQLVSNTALAPHNQLTSGPPCSRFGFQPPTPGKRVPFEGWGYEQDADTLFPNFENGTAIEVENRVTSSTANPPFATPAKNGAPTVP